MQKHRQSFLFRYHSRQQYQSADLAVNMGHTRVISSFHLISSPSMRIGFCQKAHELAWQGVSRVFPLRFAAEELRKKFVHRLSWQGFSPQLLTSWSGSTRNGHGCRSRTGSCLSLANDEGIRREPYTAVVLRCPD